mmetsp:Transcript_44305/g.172405  ORF Transcript_44305/g.172405 Transcript_44305/m.172405 type:complete len:128 (-) Transcript_44305:383-766(-)
MEAFVSTVGIGNGRDTRRMRCRRRGVVAMAKPVAEFDKVWLKLERAPDQTSSGLMLKTEEEIKQNIGVVVSVGPGDQLDDGSYESHAIKEGSKVIFNEHSGRDISLDGVDYVVCKVKDVVATFSEIE